MMRAVRGLVPVSVAAVLLFTAACSDRAPASNAAAAEGRPAAFGAPLGEGAFVDAADWRPAAGERIRLRGEVAAVCQMSGCWLKVRTAAGDLLVTFRDEAFTVPKDMAGRVVKLVGSVEESDDGLEIVADGVVFESS